MQNIHVGRGAVRGAMTIFPIWGEYAGPRGYTTRVHEAQLSESGTGPEVSSLVVANQATKPLLMLEGQILEGGWQNRMLTRSLLVAARAETPVEVVCVEAGRWGSGERSHRTFNRRGSNRVRTALRDEEDRQGEVWRRVAEFDGRLGANATSSYTEHADRAEDRIRALTDGLRPLVGQVGVLVALAGHPISAEVFDSPLTLARNFESIVNAAALDALWLPAIATPSRRARRFLDRAAQVQASPIGPAGVGVSFAGRTPYAEVATLGWRGREVHTVLTNPRHELVAA